MVHLWPAACALTAAVAEHPTALPDPTAALANAPAAAQPPAHAGCHVSGQRWGVSAYLVG